MNKINALTCSITNCSKKRLGKTITRHIPLICIAIALILGAIFSCKGYQELKGYYAGPTYRVEIPDEIAVGWDHGVDLTNMIITFVFQERPTKTTMLDVNYQFQRGTGDRSVGTETFAVLLPFNVTPLGEDGWKVERLREGVGGTLVYKRINVAENSSDIVAGGITLLLNQSIWYDYRGIYSAAINFGPGSADLQFFMRACGVSVSFMELARYRVFVEIASIINIQTIPSSHIVLSPRGNPAVLWEMQRLESITVSYTDLTEAEEYQRRLFSAGLCLGVGIPLILSGIVELSRELIRRRECNSQRTKGHTQLMFTTQGKNPLKPLFLMPSFFSRTYTQVSPFH